jgi:signal transduction histidine kinase
VVPASPAPFHDRLTAVAVGAAVVIAIGGASIGTALDNGHTAALANAVAVAFVIGTIAVVGAIVSLTVPANLVGWLLLAGAGSWGAGVGLTEAGIRGVVNDPGSVPAAGYLAAVGPAVTAAGVLVLVVAIPVVFPDGRLPGQRWRWLGWCSLAAIGCLFLGNILSPHTNEARLAGWQSPLGLPGRYAGIADAMSGVAVFLCVITAGGAVSGLVSRWRRGGPLVRQQLLLFALAACLPPIVLVGAVLTNNVPGWVFAVAVVPLPLAIAAAVLSHGLYDLRRAANRTLLWLTMSLSVAGIYSLVVVFAAAVVPDDHSWWPSAVAAGVAALLLIPLHQTFQRAVNRIVYGRWHEPYEVLAGLGEQLEAAADVDRLLTATVTELTSGLDLHEVSVRALDGTAIVGDLRAGSTLLPLQAYGATVGWLSYRPPPRQLSGAEERLVRDLARQLGAVLHARRLQQDLQRARERLVLAREEERRRLRRDLHDGIGPALAGLTLKAHTVQASLPPGAEDASLQLQVLSEEIRQTVTDVRHVVEGLRPPALDELGLVAACTKAVERLAADAGLVVTVDAPDDLPLLPAAVEVASYRIVVEAVTNVVRHADARRCQVVLAVASGTLAVTVTDDGVGLGTSQGNGHGLAIIRERAEELGGEVAIADSSRGLKIHARLPIDIALTQRGTPPRAPT